MTVKENWKKYISSFPYTLSAKNKKIERIHAHLKLFFEKKTAFYEFIINISINY